MTGGAEPLPDTAAILVDVDHTTGAVTLRCLADGASYFVPLATHCFGDETADFIARHRACVAARTPATAGRAVAGAS